MIAVANGLGKTIEMIDPVKLLAVQKVANILFLFSPQSLCPLRARSKTAS